MLETDFKPGKHLFALFIFSLAGLAGAGDLPPDRSPARVELYAGFSHWPALAALKPVVDGEFNPTGVGLGASIHTEFRTLESSEVLLGIDAWMYLNDSNIAGFQAAYFAQHMYFGGSARWRLGERRNLLIDAGAGFHLVDLTDVQFFYGGYAEYPGWQSWAPGVFVGATWDFPRSDPEKTIGWFVSFRTHFVDFGSVHDDSAAPLSILGQAAGSLNGPIYQLQFGYGGS